MSTLESGHVHMMCLPTHTLKHCQSIIIFSNSPMNIIIEALFDKSVILTYS